MADLFNQTMTTLERSLTCELIASDLTGSILPLETSEAEILALALEHQFSRVPLQTAGQAIVSHVALVDLQQQQIQDRRAVLPQDLISGDTPLGRVPQILQEREFCFVLVQDRIQKILTRSDLNKLPMRVYLTTLLVHLEGTLTEAIEAVLPNDAWKALIKSERVDKIQALFEEKKAADFDTRLIDCTMLSDKITIIKKSDQLSEKMPLPSNKKTKKQLGRINSLRDRLAHTLPPITEEPDLLRNHLYHGQQLVKVRDVEWLTETVGLLNAWIDGLTNPDEAV